MRHEEGKNLTEREENVGGKDIRLKGIERDRETYMYKETDRERKKSWSYLEKNN